MAKLLLTTKGPGSSPFKEINYELQIQLKIATSWSCATLTFFLISQIKNHIQNLCLQATPRKEALLLKSPLFNTRIYAVLKQIHKSTFIQIHSVEEPVLIQKKPIPRNMLNTQFFQFRTYSTP